MGKMKKEPTKISRLLIYMAAASDALSPVVDPYELRRRVKFGSPDSFSSTVYRMQKRGWVRFVDRDAQKFIQLTKRGQLEALISKARLPVSAAWDGKWRMLIFDIPEDTSSKRNLLRGLLKKNNFYQLQASVYINPYQLNREAVRYLHISKLDKFIRILRIDEIDDDADLRKHFKLK